MKIVVMMEGNSEECFLPFVKNFLKARIPGAFPKIVSSPYDGRLPKGERLKKDVERFLKTADHVIALTDVYTGPAPRDFHDAAEAKRKMREWVGKNDRFHPHAAQHEFEAWLLPYWEEIKRLAGSDRNRPGGSPESVNHNKPPSHHIKEVFRTGGKGKIYSKNLTPAKILEGQDLTMAANACPELKAFLNTLLSLSGGRMI